MKKPQQKKDALPLGETEKRALSGDVESVFNATFTGHDLRNSVFAHSHIENSTFSRCNISSCRFEESTIRNSNFAGIIAPKANFYDSEVTNCDFTGANLESANFKNSNLTGSVFKDADLRRTKFANSILAEVDFRGADLIGAPLQGAILEGCYVDETTKITLPPIWKIIDGIIRPTYFQPRNGDVGTKFIENIIENSGDDVLLLCKSMLALLDGDIEKLKSTIPNEENMLSIHSECISTLVGIRLGLEKISNLLLERRNPREISSAIGELSQEIENWFRREKAEVVDYIIRVPAAAGGIGLLKIAGANMPMATAAVLGFMGITKATKLITSRRKS